MNADRNLLFGILAFQNNFIDRKALLAAFERWTSDKTRSLGDILIDNNQLDLRYRELLDGLVAAHLEQHGADAAKSLAAVSSLGTLRKELEQIADPDLQASMALTATLQVDPSAVPTVWARGSSSSAMRFTILRPHAKGGLGQISLARDEELNREVAFKEIQVRFADDPASQSRFLLEGEITGGLEHPGIVPVYGMGQYGDGRPFYAMRFIQGDSLHDAIKVFHGGSTTDDQPPVGERITELRKLLGRFIDICNAIEYAHSRGVLHRDLKPGNVMLGKYGETLVVDWGLAKTSRHGDSEGLSGERTLRPASGSGSAPTQMGSAIGTPQYMSPEQAEGRLDELGPTTDVYSLGATLYCLLTGRAPFADSDVKSTIEQVSRGRFPAPRTIKRDVSPALQAICLKAMALAPKQRYASARALGDDIERWLNDQPVSVYRDPFSRRLARWVRNHKATSGAIVAASVVLVVGAIVGSMIVRRTQERTENITRARGLVDSLVTADARQVPEILKQLSQNAQFARQLLEEKLAQAKDGSTEKLHLLLALVDNDERRVDYLYEQLLRADADRFPVIRDALVEHKTGITDRLWVVLAGQEFDPENRRLRAAGALALYDPENARWGEVAPEVARQLVAVNPAFLGPWRDALRGVAAALVEPLTKIFSDARQGELPRSLATSLLADYVSKDAKKLASLISEADASAYRMLFPVLQMQAAAAREPLTTQVNETPAAELLQSQRVALGRRRAGAAVTLLRQGERDSILEVLRAEHDPESRTQFIHYCRSRGVTAGELLECLARADALRQAKTGAARRIEDRVLYGLLLALGEYELAELPDSQREAFLGLLTSWYANDGSSAVHGATGWLLRRWKQDQAPARVEHTPVPYSPDREWFTVEIKHKADGPVGQIAGDGVFHLTFVVFPAGDYMIGSSLDEADRQADETLHQVKLTRPLAVSDREITWEQYNSFDNQAHHDAWEKQFGHQLSPAEPTFGVSWYEAVSYCRWLSARAGLAEAEQAYPEPSSLDPQQFAADPDPQAFGAPRNWPVNLGQPGFRLPTEAEWEVACRSGTGSPYSFGSDAQLLGYYGWLVDNSQKWSHPTSQLRPNPRGLFDMHGNLSEWCHDWYGSYMVDRENPLGPETGSIRLTRGGGWPTPAAFCRSAIRVSNQPMNRAYSLGFRVVTVPFDQASQPAD